MGGILRTKEVVEGSCYSIRNGWLIDSRVDLWCPGIDEKVLRIWKGWLEMRGLRLAEFRNEITNDWKIRMLLAWFPPREVGEIQKLQWPLVECHDKIMWIASGNSQFFVKSCHKVLANQEGLESNGTLWRDIWKAPIPKRSKLFMWRTASNV